MARNQLVSLSHLLLLFVCLQPAMAGKKTYIGRRLSASQLVSMDQVQHQVWSSLLRKYVDEDGLVNYRAIKQSREDRQRLEQYIDTLSSANPSASAKRASKLAFWINAYNAVTLHGILKEYPTKSIREHASKFVGYNIWHDYQLIVGGKAYSLDQMEHQILRKLNEPRIHFAIVCASIGCPRLLAEAYVPDRLNEQLDLNAKDFFSRSQNFRHDQSQKRFYLSELLCWFGSDFGSDQAAQLSTLSHWLPTPAAQRAARQNAVRIKFLEYDWKLNDQKPTAAASR